MNNALAFSKILVVDDIEYNQVYVSEVLRGNGYKSIAVASNGKEAFEKIEAFQPDLILLDIVLPDISGLDICKKIKSDPATKDIIVVVQSGMTQQAQKKIAFNVGASDFINKPLEPVELLSRVRLQLEQRNLTVKLQDANNRLMNDLNEASFLVESMLPQTSELNKICNDNNISVDVVYQPSSELGGDFIGIRDVAPGKLAVYFWDFSGHGIKAALNTIRLHAMMSDFKMATASPAKFVTSVNHNINRISHKEFYATMFCGVINIVDRSMEYSFASCPPPILISFKSDSYKLIDTTEFPVGVVDNHCYSNYKVTLRDVDVLIIYSDALIETPNASGECMTPDDVAKLILAHYKATKLTDAQSIKTCVMEEFVRNYAINVSDDLTMSVMSLCAPAAKSL